jgi:hypothetical protein
MKGTTPRTCEGCGAEVAGKYRRRRCSPCYRRVLRLEHKAARPTASQESLWQGEQPEVFAKVFGHTTPGPDGCIIFTGREKTRGYGRVYLGKGREASAHRVAYELRIGPIPDGMTIDHVCHNRSASCPGGPSCLHRRCVNPNHLEAVTSEENTRRAAARPNHKMGGRGQRRPLQRQQACQKGHEMTPENTTWEKRDNGGSGRVARCRRCRRETQAAYQRRRREAASAS